MGWIKSKPLRVLLMFFLFLIIVTASAYSLHASEAINLYVVGDAILDVGYITGFAAKNVGCIEGDEQCHPSRTNYYQVCEVYSKKSTRWINHQCNKGMACSEKGGEVKCVCTDENSCEAYDEKMCKGNVIYTCTTDKNGCLKWTRESRCSSGLTCSDGACICTKENSCEVEGETTCKNQYVYSCELDSNGCLKWAKEKNCEKGMTCVDGACECNFYNPCEVEGETLCVSNNKYDACTENSNGCLVWGSRTKCSSGTLCIDGACECSDYNSCSIEGETKCTSTNRYQVCEADSNGCLKWSSNNKCSGKEVCSEGECIEGKSQDSNVCELGALSCIGNYIYECRENKKQIAQLYRVEKCVYGTYCNKGECTAPLDVVCTLGEKRCIFGDVQECIESNSIGNKWMKIEDCGGDTVCIDSACECKDYNSCGNEGEKKCYSTYYAQECELKESGCLKWSKTIRCGSGERCYEGECLLRHCLDNIQNEDEEDVDCGGEDCLPCVVEPECENGEEKCENTIYFLCEDYNWTNKGEVVGECGVVERECEDEEEKCEGTISFICENEVWVDQGEIVGKCGVEPGYSPEEGEYEVKVGDIIPITIKKGSDVSVKYKSKTSEGARVVISEVETADTVNVYEQHEIVIDSISIGYIGITLR